MFIDRKTQYGKDVNFPPKQNTGLTQFLLRFQKRFYRCRQDYTEIYIEKQRNYKSENNFEKVKKMGGMSLPNFKTYYIATAIRFCDIGKRIDK